MRDSLCNGGFISFVAIARVVYEGKLLYEAIKGGVKERNRFIRYLLVCLGRYCSMAVSC